MRRIIKSKNNERVDILVEVILNENIIRFTGRYKQKNMERIIVDIVELSIDSDSETINQTIANLALSISNKMIKYLNIVDIFNEYGTDLTVEIFEEEN